MTRSDAHPQLFGADKPALPPGDIHARHTETGISSGFVLPEPSPLDGTQPEWHQQAEWVSEAVDWLVAGAPRLRALVAAALNDAHKGATTCHTPSGLWQHPPHHLLVGHSTGRQAGG